MRWKDPYPLFGAGGKFTYKQNMEHGQEKQRGQESIFSTRRFMHDSLGRLGFICNIANWTLLSLLRLGLGGRGSDGTVGATGAIGFLFFQCIKQASRVGQS